VTGELEGYECLQASRHPLYDVSGTEREKEREREREREIWSCSMSDMVRESWNRTVFS